MGTTPGGLPYMDDTDPLAGVAQKMKGLAEAASALYVRKPALTSRANVAVEALDPHLQVQLPAPGTYEFVARLGISSAANAAGDFSAVFSWPGAGGVCDVFGFGLHNSLASGSNGPVEVVARLADIVSPSSPTPYGASTSQGGLILSGTVTTTAGGTFGLMWSQFAANASPTTLAEGSSLTVRRVA